MRYVIILVGSLMLVSVLAGCGELLSPNPRLVLNKNVYVTNDCLRDDVQPGAATPMPNVRDTRHCQDVTVNYTTTSETPIDADLQQRLENFLNPEVDVTP